MLSRIFQFSNSVGLRQASFVSGGNIVATAMSALALLILSRLLGPEQFGQFNVGFALLLIFSRITDLGLNAATVKFVSQSKSKKQKNGFATGTTQLKFITSMLLVGFAQVLTPDIASWLRFDNPTIIYAAFWLSLVTVWFEHAIFLLQALHKFGWVVIFTAVQAGAKLLFVLGLWTSQQLTATWAFILYNLGPIIALVLVPFAFSAKDIVIRFNFRGNKYIRQVVTFARHTSVGFIAAGLIEQSDILLIQRYLQDFEVGVYSGASRIAMLVLLVAYSLGGVLNARVARYSDQELVIFLHKAGWLLIGCLLVAFVLVPLTPLIIWISLGSSYLAGAGILSVLLLASLITLATMPFIAVFYAVDRPEYFSIAGIAQLIVVIGGNILFTPVFGLWGAAGVRLASRVALAVITIGWGVWMVRSLVKTHQNPKLSKLPKILNGWF